MAERRIALIPRVQAWPPGAAFPGEYAAYLTDQRTILCEEKSPTDAPPGLRASMVGQIIAAAQDSLKETVTRDYSMADPEALANTLGNIVIWHQQIRRIRTWVEMGNVMILLFFYDKGRRPDYVIKPVPPEALIQARKKQGQSASKTHAEYRQSTQDAFKRVLPAAVVEGTKWRR